MTSDQTPPPRASRRRTIGLLVVLCMMLALVVFLGNWYWLPQFEATQRAKEYMQQAHPNLTYQSIQVWKRWDGHWAVEFDSEPPVRIDVDRHGGCAEGAGT